MLGTSQTMYARYERGANELPIRHLRKLCIFFNVSADYILDIDHDDSRRPGTIKRWSRPIDWPSRKMLQLCADTTSSEGIMSSSVFTIPLSMRCYWTVSRCAAQLCQKFAHIPIKKCIFRNDSAYAKNSAYAVIDCRMQRVRIGIQSEYWSLCIAFGGIALIMAAANTLAYLGLPATQGSLAARRQPRGSNRLGWAFLCQFLIGSICMFLLHLHFFSATMAGFQKGAVANAIYLQATAPWYLALRDNPAWKNRPI